jgi:hypothetical protein
MPLDHWTVEGPRRVAEVAEDILHANMVWIGAFAAHTASIVARVLR